MRSELYPGPSMFTVEFDLDGRQVGVTPVVERYAGHPSYDVAVAEFTDDGDLVDPRQLDAALRWIDELRNGGSYSKGLVVVSFIHGWHHGASWNPETGAGDSHFAGFRRILRFLALREAERNDARRVVGIYIGWSGEPTAWWKKSTLVSFYDRYSHARRIGEGAPLREALREIMKHSKLRTQQSQSPPSQVILMGHSMGGLMLETVLLELISDREGALYRHAESGLTPVRTLASGRPVTLPDLVVSLNSAGDSEITRRIGEELAAQGVSKAVEGERIGYAPPMLVSFTSTADWVTQYAWRIANPRRRTVGHDASLFTHQVTSEGRRDCKPLDPERDFGQNFHCLRAPRPAGVPTPAFSVDLPEEERRGKAHYPDHVRYTLRPMGSMSDPELVWVFQVPPELVEGHNDIFNSKSTSLILALAQISGAVMSLAPDWESSFEEETPSDRGAGAP